MAKYDVTQRPVVGLLSDVRDENSRDHSRPLPPQDLIIEVSHIVVFTGEIDPYAKTRLHKDGATIPDSSGRKSA
jgi:hypothetical protein